MSDMKSRNQYGFVSIIVAATIMIILSLLTIGFTRLMQREQRQALDRQLSRQALYAAESGINDTLAAIQSNIATDDAKTDCAIPAWLPATIDATSGIEYTCVQYDQSPPRLDYTVRSGESKIVQLQTSTGNPFNDFTIEWSNSEGDNTIGLLPLCSSAGQFPSSRANTVPILKFELTNNVNYDRTNLINSTDHMYFVPCRTGGATSHNYTPTQKGNIVFVNCSAAPCRVTINNVAGANSATFLARFRPIYTAANVTIRANELAGGVPTEAELMGQISIDVTAKASDVIRRLRATYATTEAAELPEAVVHAFDGICKRLEVGTSTILDGC